MRDRNLLHLFLGLNVALAVAFAAYLFLSSNSQPKVVATNFATSPKTNQTGKASATNVAKLAPAKTNAPDRGRSPAAAPSLHTWEMQNILGTERYLRDAADLARTGLYLDLPAHAAQLFHFAPSIH